MSRVYMGQYRELPTPVNGSRILVSCLALPSHLVDLISPAVSCLNIRSLTLTLQKEDLTPQDANKAIQRRAVLYSSNKESLPLILTLMNMAIHSGLV